MTRSFRRLGFSFAFAAALLLPGCASVDQDDGESAARGVMVGEKITRHGKVISIDANTRTVDIDQTLMGFPAYAELQGVPVQVPLKAGHLKWLKEHWQQYGGNRVRIQ